MEDTGCTKSIKISTDELIELIPDEQWKTIQKVVLKKINEEFNEKFTSFDDIIEQTGFIDILVSR